MYEIEDILEKMASLEHDQWTHWTKYMLSHLTEENIERWMRQIQTPYSELIEGEKASDREHAQKVIDLFEDEEICLLKRVTALKETKAEE